VARDLTDLTRIIRRIEAKTRTSNPLASPSARPTLEALLDGTVEETERGKLLVVRRRFPVGHRHGAQPLLAAREASPAALALLSRGGLPVTEGRRLLYLDTETTGLAGGTGTYAFLVGVGFFDGDEFEVRQFFMRDLDEEPALLTVLEETFRKFDGFVTYNGAGFDLPLLETRFVLARRRFPGDVFHVDLLGPARRLWSARLADCRLGTVEQSVLRFIRDDDLPGALIPTVYFEYLRRKRPDELPRVFEHNRHDILSLAALTGWSRTRWRGRRTPSSIRKRWPASAGCSRARTRSGAWPATAWRSTRACRRPRASACYCGSPIARSGWRAGTRHACSGRRRPAHPASSTRGRGRRSPRSTSIAGAISRRRSRSWSRP
jgi:uncharacterized protein YprB with RNaseH-like and TPR domain